MWTAIWNYIQESPLDVLGTALGLLYLWLELKENAWMWVVGAIMPMVYTVVLYQSGIYADCAMEFYYFLAGVYGLLYWLGVIGKKKGKAVAIGYTPTSLWTVLAGVTAILWVSFWWILSTFTDSTVPVADALSTALSIVALWMLSRKYLEQWLVWLVVDAISVGLYVYKGIYGRSLLYLIYTLMAVYGFFVWRRKMLKPAP